MPLKNYHNICISNKETVISPNNNEPKRNVDLLTKMLLLMFRDFICYYCVAFGSEQVNPISYLSLTKNTPEKESPNYTVFELYMNERKTNSVV